MVQYIFVVQSTFPSVEDAHLVTEGLIQKKWVACAQHQPAIQSVYLWQGAVHSELECVVTYKTVEQCLDRVMAYIREHHAYEVPEIIAWPVPQGSAAYLKWVEETVNIEA